MKKLIKKGLNKELVQENGGTPREPISNETLFGLVFCGLVVGSIYPDFTPIKNAVAWSERQADDWRLGMPATSHTLRALKDTEIMHTKAATDHLLNVLIKQLPTKRRRELNNYKVRFRAGKKLSIEKMRQVLIENGFNEAFPAYWIAPTK